MSLDEELKNGTLTREEISRLSRRNFLGTGARVAGAVLAGEGLLSLYGCGGGGGSPTGPGPNPTPPPTTGNAVVIGKFVNLENGNAYSGATVTIGSKTAQTDAQGNFRVEGVGAGEQVMTLLGGGSLERKVKVNVAANATNNYGTIDTVPGDFPLDFFNKVCRANNQSGDQGTTIPDGTTRWITVPTVYADRDGLSGLPNRYIDTERDIRRMVGEAYPALTNNFMANVPINFVGSGQMPADKTPGVILVRAGNESVPAFHIEYINGTNIVSALVVFSSALSSTSIAQDMCQPLGFREDYPGTGDDSLFWDRRSVRITDPTAKDIRMGKYLYSRPSGARSQDDTSHLSTLSASSIARLPMEVVGMDENMNPIMAPVTQPVEVAPHQRYAGRPARAAPESRRNYKRSQDE